MTDFKELAQLATGSAHSLLGGGVATVTSADSAVVINDVNVVIEEDAMIQSDNGMAIYGQTVISFDKAEIVGIILQRGVIVVVSGGSSYKIREIQTEDAWAVTASASKIG